MTHPDSRTIEDGLERQRARLTATLDELNERVSVENLAREAVDMLRANAAAYTGSIDRAVRANPLALAVTGIGLAWLIFGSRDAAPDPAAASGAGRDPGDAAPCPEAGAGEAGWSARLQSRRAAASDALRRIDDDARIRARDARDLAAERAQVLTGFTDDMRAAFREGLDDLSDAARQRVVTARETAYGARLRLGQAARSGGRESERLMTEHPLVAGALAMALGAALAAALPRTRVEDRAFGAESDRMMRRAADVLRQERDRMARVADAVADEAEASARDATDTAAGKTGELYQNVRDRAAREAGASPRERF